MTPEEQVATKVLLSDEHRSYYDMYLSQKTALLEFEEFAHNTGKPQNNSLWIEFAKERGYQDGFYKRTLEDIQKFQKEYENNCYMTMSSDPYRRVANSTKRKLGFNTVINYALAFCFLFFCATWSPDPIPKKTSPSTEVDDEKQLPPLLTLADEILKKNRQPNIREKFEAELEDKLKTEAPNDKA